MKRYITKCLTRDKEFFHKDVRSPYMIDIDSLVLPTKRIPLTVNHNHGKIIGYADNFRRQQDGLYADLHCFRAIPDTLKKSSIEFDFDDKSDSCVIQNAVLQGLSACEFATDNETFIEEFGK